MSPDLTHHARVRLQQRAVPPLVLGLLDASRSGWPFGPAAGNGVLSYALPQSR